ncbi:aldehyde dehydrogenase family protein, partial [Escherichia coli]|nr:aldehyde dehydrogenase family protein [Escherichia coli]
GETKEWIPELKEALAKVQPGAWDDETAGYGPLISPQAKQRVVNLINEGKASGANCVLDGTDCQVPGFPNGNWVGPTLFTNVTTDMSIYQE